MLTGWTGVFGLFEYSDGDIFGSRLAKRFRMMARTRTNRIATANRQSSKPVCRSVFHTRPARVCCDSVSAGLA